MRKILCKVAVFFLLLLTTSNALAVYNECTAPPFVAASAPPLVMMVMERDHKLFFEAYNDASDLDGDGELDVGYHPYMEYTGYFDPRKCYIYDGDPTPLHNNGKFTPQRMAERTEPKDLDNDGKADKYKYVCGGAGEWSGNFLNWLSMSRMDVLKKVLYGGQRPNPDSVSQTDLHGVYIPQDGHSWGKEYSASDTRLLTPFDAPEVSNGKRHLFCVTSPGDGDEPVIKVALNDSNRAWDWASTERPVCDGPKGTRGPVGTREDITSYTVMVDVCKSVGKVCSESLDSCENDDDCGADDGSCVDTLESNCKEYPAGYGVSKPIGLLQKYAEGKPVRVCSKSWKACQNDNDCSTQDGFCIERADMYMGLITGSYSKNMSGGILRKNFWGILDEINSQTGQFTTEESTKGNIVQVIDMMKTIGFNYGTYAYDENIDKIGCGWIPDRPLSEGECRMWGNPIAEMMYEALRYIAGKGTASGGGETSAFNYTTTSDAATLKLSKPYWGITKDKSVWRQPYEVFPLCANPFLLVLSDINTSYDSDQLPGVDSSFGSFTGDLAGLNVSTLANSIGTQESIAGGSWFIGQSGSVYDFICSPKNVTNLSNIRGLCPEEPTKQGSYYAPAVAYYGKTKFSENNSEKPNVTTLAVALASPVPDIQFKVGGKDVRIVPIGKTVSGSYNGNVCTSCYEKCAFSVGEKGLVISGCSSDAYCPSNQIVDFYVEEVDYDDDHNLTYAKFRISFEDVEQGADFDMDSIVSYTIQPISGDEIKISLDSSIYAAGGYDQVLGFVISGTNEDGVYLPVRDKDVSRDEDKSTCSQEDTPEIVYNMPLTWEKTFTVTGGSASVLKDPLWYAAKWGGFTDMNGNNKPDLQQEWDANNDGTPDNYFYVVNPLKLEEQLEKAFIAILSRGGSAGAVATVTQQVQGEDIVVRGAFTSYEDDPSTFVWKGHLEAYWPYEGCSTYTTEAECEKVTGCTWNDSCTGKIYSFQNHPGNFCSEIAQDGNCWEAEQYMPAPGARKIITLVDGTQTEFTSAEICTDDDLLKLAGDSSFTTADCADLLDWVRGTDNPSGSNKFRDRDGWALGDIVYSTPVVVQPPSLSAVSYEAIVNGGECDQSDTGPCKDGCLGDNATKECTESCYYCFREVYGQRKKMIYVGGNDGMLHAFVAGVWNSTTNTWDYNPANNSQIGKELWAYIPSNLLTKLKELARLTYGSTDHCVHRFMVDLSPQSWQVFIDPTGNGANRQWRTVLLGGERGGGDIYFAIDVTDPDNPKVLWEYPVLRNAAQVSSGSYKVDFPFLDKATYEQVKAFPTSWSVPYVGKLKIPNGVSFWAANPVPSWAAGTPALSVAEHTYGSTDLSGWFAVIGTAPRIFDQDDWPATLSADQKDALLKPHLLMIDIEKGINIFQYLWPLVTAFKSSLWPVQTADTNHIPYSLSNPVALDIWNASGKTGSDGYLDHIYVGDINGLLYGMKFNMEDSSSKGMLLDVWKTKSIDELSVSNVFRSSREPIAVMPVVAFDPLYNLNIYFGTGKYDNVDGASNDKTDAATMAFYAKQDSGYRPTIAPTGIATFNRTASPPYFTMPASGNGFTLNGFGINIDSSECPDTIDYNSSCTWTKGSGKPDCCEDTTANPDCNSPCWDCVLSLRSPGERVVDSALVAGELVLFTTFLPKTDPCLVGGEAYLYVLDYRCGALTTNPLGKAGFTDVGSAANVDETGEYGKITKEVDGETETVGYVAMLGAGMPSRPALDSSARFVFVQTSDAQIHKIELELPAGTFYLRGWKEEETEQ